MGVNNVETKRYRSVFKYLLGYSLALIMLIGVLAALFEDRFFVRIIGIIIAVVSWYVNWLLWKKKKMEKGTVLLNEKNDNTGEK